MHRRVLLLVCLLSLPASLWAAIVITLPNAPDSLKFAVIGDSGSGAAGNISWPRSLSRRTSCIRSRSC